jgi:hypothetical protein
VVAVSPSATDNLLLRLVNLSGSRPPFSLFTLTSFSQHDSSLLAFAHLLVDVQTFLTRSSTILNKRFSSNLVASHPQAPTHLPTAPCAQHQLSIVFVVLFNWLAQPFSQSHSLLSNFFVGYLVYQQVKEAHFQIYDLGPFLTSSSICGKF